MASTTARPTLRTSRATVVHRCGGHGGVVAVVHRGDDPFGHPPNQLIGQPGHHPDHDHADEFFDDQAAAGAEKNRRWR